MRPDMMYLSEILRNAIGSCDPDLATSRFRFSVHDIMTVTLPFLDAQQGLELIDAVAIADCVAKKEEQTLLWLELYRAVARRDSRMMSAASRRLLSEDANTPQTLRDYLIMAAMLGDIAAGRPSNARTVWDQYAEKAFEDRELVAHVELISRIALGSDAKSPGHSEASSP